jgi:hypothetical protein
MALLLICAITVADNEVAGGLDRLEVGVLVDAADGER